MGVTSILVKQVIVMIITMLAAAATDGLNLSSDCVRRCKGVDIPYPFGTSRSCALEEKFVIRCEDNHSYPVLGKNLNVSNISILDHEISILSFVARDCYDANGQLVYHNEPWLWVGLYGISDTKNKFIVLGCDSYAYLKGETYSMGCMSICNNVESVRSDSSCSGVGCCKTQIPHGIKNITVKVNSFENHTFENQDRTNFNNCTYAFVAQENYFNFSTAYLENFDEESVPLVLDWAIARNDSCGPHSYLNGTEVTGYHCKCKPGFHGNPYLSDANGCQDINECADDGLHDCSSSDYCINKEGTWACSCPSNFIGNGRRSNGTDGNGCRAKPFPLIYKVLIGVAAGFVTLLSSCCMHFVCEERKLRKLKQKLFRQNGGLILQQQLHRLPQQENSNVRVKIFTEEELRNATHNYDDSTIIGQGGFGTVYKGNLADNKVVAIKMSKIVDQSQIEQFINEVVVVSQINHRNVVKLLGCCLETQVPLLVYEYIPNGTLFEHLHDKDRASKLVWEIRLNIATETAGALSYLHSAASTPIVHRDVKPSNILLENYTAKISDFGASKLVPLDQTGVATMVQGTLGYLDPEYLHTNQLTEKSDVYSFGVVLVELLTGRKALSLDRIEEERSLATYFLSSFKEGRLFEILDSRIVKKENEMQLKEVAKIAKCCLKVEGKDRPGMKEVAMELEEIRKIERHPWVAAELNLEENDYLLGEISNAYEQDTKNANESIKEHVILDFSGR